MRKLTAGVAAVLLGAFCSAGVGHAAEAAKVKVLIVSGDDVGAHKWQETTPCTKDILDKAGTFDTTVVEGLAILDSTDELARYDVIYFMLYNNKINVLVTADSTFSNKTEPLVWTVDYGKGRVAGHTFGHDKKAFESTGVQKIIVNATLWAATGKTE